MQSIAFQPVLVYRSDIFPSHSPAVQVCLVPTWWAPGAPGAQTAWPSLMNRFERCLVRYVKAN